MEISQILTALGLLFTILTTYIVNNNKRVRFETETKMKFAELERRFIEHKENNEAEFKEIWRENKEDHLVINKNLQEVGNALNGLKLEIAKKL
jgi:hypothetical protein